ncbi:protein disulfide-isomerase A3-like [Gigantopelta aegis]|uniref:protein disulfide-isomerase A3-like n=1 Tax=Gigantopelta aegis TaxID=1735272 RepID=UPI001B88D015|nr:protein disulfide-isomerase A3-like [Gigantopelta aegis]
MKSVLLLLAFLSLASSSDVLEFTDDDFDDKVEQESLILVEFFAPWCGHCKKLAPEFEKAATALKRNDPPVPLAKVDCTVNTKACGKHGVSGYPTLKIFRNGISEDFNGPREADGIVKMMKSKAGPTSKELTSVEDADKFLDNAEYGVIGFFESAEDTDAKTFQKVADSMSSDMRFAHTYEKSVKDKLKVKEGIVLYRPKRFHSKFEENTVEFNDDMKVPKIKSWIEETSIGLCPLRTQDLAEKLKKPLFVAYYNVDYTKNVKGTNYWRNRIMKVGSKLQKEGKKVYFAISNHSDMSFELTECGIEDANGEKPVVCARDTRDRKFKMTDEFSMDTFEQFVKDVLDDKVEPYLKSEPVPDNTDNAVKVVVAKNFDEIVNDEEKDVLIEFYAPWCGHCKSLAPKYDELAEKLKDEPSITIAKMDATANDVSKPYEVQGFPTIYFSPKGSKGSPKKYSGGREVDDFLKYLAKEATDELQGFSRNGKKKKTTKKQEL